MIEFNLVAPVISLGGAGPPGLLATFTDQDVHLCTCINGIDKEEVLNDLLGQVQHDGRTKSTGSLGPRL